MIQRQPLPATRCLGVRGAITAGSNTVDGILAATRELLTEIVAANGIVKEDIGGVFITTTMDLNAEFPAVAARQLGWEDTAILCGHEMAVPDGPSRTIRVMVMWNTSLAARDIQHVYLGEAQRLRPDRPNGRLPADVSAANVPIPHTASTSEEKLS
ncbi:MAG: chorismate mutase [Candidatus Promineifilaceae bacterium]